MKTPKRIHKDDPMARKLSHLHPQSAYGAFRWVLEGDYWYPHRSSTVVVAPVIRSGMKLWQWGLIVFGLGSMVALAVKLFG